MNLDIKSENLDILSSVKPAGNIVMGKVTKGIAFGKKWKFACQISQRLKLHPNTMLQWSPEVLVKSVDEGRTIFCLDGNEKLLAFGQIWHYGQNLNGQEVYEFGSWLSFTKRVGYGQRVLNSAIELAPILFPDSQLIAILEYCNNVAQNIVEQSGGTLLGHKFSEYLRTQDGFPSLMRIYDITKCL